MAEKGKEIGAESGAVPEVETRDRPCVDLHRLCQETGMTLKEIAALCGIKNVNNVYRWGKSARGSRPEYDSIVLLMERGASAEAIFGRRFKEAPSSIPTSEEFAEGVRKVIEQMKSEGRI